MATATVRRLRFACWWVLLPLFVVAAVPASLAQSTPRYVLVLTSFEQQFSPYNVFNSAFRAELTERSPEPVQFIDVSLPSSAPGKRRSNEPQATLDYLKTTFAMHRPDLVMSVGGVAAMFLQQHRAALFPDMPILFSSVDQRFIQNNRLTADQVAVAVSIDPRLLLENILQVLPRTKTLAVVIGSSELDSAWRMEMARAFEPFGKRIHVLWFNNLSFDEMLKRSRTLPPDTAILFAHLGIDAKGIPIVEERALVQLRAVANAPIFGVYGSQLGHGIVGGPLLDLQELGRNTAAMAVRILNGESPQGLTPPPQPLGPPAYDDAQLDRWQISESRLPASSVVHFRPVTPWQRYRTQIVAAVVFGLVETALLIGLLVLHFKRKRAEGLRQESESRFRLLADNAPVMIWMAGEDGKGADFNRAWLEFTGRTLDEERGDHWMTGVHPDDLDMWQQTYGAALERREPFRLEYRLRHAGGEYRWILHAAVPRFTSTGTFVGYAGSAVDITEHRLAAAALSTLSQRLMQAQEQERARIGRELHDDVCQRLAAFTVQLAHLMQRLPGDNTVVKEAVADLSRKSRELGTDVQALSHRLHSSKLEVLGLPAAAAAFCRELSEQQGIAITFNHAQVPAQLPEETRIGLFRVMQEALMNAVKHAGVGQVDVSLRGSGESVHLDVTDQGAGFDMDAAHQHQGLGLVSMRQRLNLMGGELQVRSKRGQGTTISARVPRAARARES